MPPGESAAEKSERLMNTLAALLDSSTLEIAGKKPQFVVCDALTGYNVSNAHECMVTAVPKKHLREDSIVIVSMLNLPSTIRLRPYTTEYALKNILTTYANTLMEASLLIPRFMLCFEAEVGGELPAIGTKPFCTNDGKSVAVPCMVVSPHSWEKKPKDDHALVVSRELHATVVK